MVARAAALSGSILTLGPRAQLARPAVEAVLLAECGKVLASGRAKWPVVTGRSRAGLKLEITRNGTRIRVEIVNYVEYAPLIRPKALGGRLLAWEEYVEKPLHAALPAIRAKMARAVIDAMKRGHRG